MANIAVIVLKTEQIDPQPKLCSKRLQIEDNIGEAIHIHWRNLRLDFTIRDFLELANVCEQARSHLDALQPKQSPPAQKAQPSQTTHGGTGGTDQKKLQVQFDPAFVKTMGQMTQYVTDAKVLEMPLDNLLCINILSKNPYQWEPKAIIESKPYKCLQGDTESYKRYIEQFGEPDHGPQNFYSLKKSIEQHGYPQDNNMIVIFGDQPYIRDGQHRAAILRHLHGNIRVPVLQLLFKDSYSGWRMNPVSKPGPSESGPSQIQQQQKVLIVRPDAIGDFVIFSGVLKHLRDQYKNAELVVLTQEHIVELAQSCPYIDSVIGFNRTRARSDQQYYRDFLEQLKAAKFDIAVNAVYSRDSISDSLTLGSEAKVTIASAGNESNMSSQQKDSNDRIYTHLIPASDKPMLETSRNLEFVSGLTGRNLGQTCMPEVWTNREDETAIEELLNCRNAKDPIVICPFGNNSIRNWPDQKWAQLISIYKEHIILICGSPQDSQTAEMIIRQADHPNIHNLCGKTSLGQFAALLKKAKICIGAESAAGHLAAAVHCPHVIIIGGGHFGRFMPYSPDTTLVHLSMPCYHCNWHCKYGQARCITQIRVETVDLAVRRTLDGSGIRRSEPLLIEETLKSDCVPTEPDQFNSKPHADIDISEIDKDSKYLVTAIVSTYNAERFFAGCLDDLENQTIADRLEIIVVNSGSQQNEEAIVKEYQNKYDNIKYIKTEQRETIYKAWNRAIKIASGQYITNANTDDRHRPDAIETLVREMEKNPDKVLAYSNQKRTEQINGRQVAAGELIKGEFSRARLFGGECPPGSQPLWRKYVHDLMGYFDESFFIGGDLEFWFRLTQKYDFLYVDEILGERLIRPDAVSESNNDLIRYENIVINKCYNYALQTSTMVESSGISDNPLFSDWPEIHLWKRKVKAKIQGTADSEKDTIKNQWDLRTQDKPELSVIVVTHNRPQQLIETLSALQNQSEDEFEVVVISNGGELSGVRAQADRFKYGIRGVELIENLGPSYARNLGASEARADYIAFLDDDAVPDKDFVGNIIAHFKKLDICGLRGKVLPGNTTDSQMVPASYDLGNEVISTACEISSHSAYKKDIFQQAGGFNPDLFGYENQELSYRIYKSQNEQIDCIAYVPEVKVYHDSGRDFEHSIEKSLREKEMSILAGRKWPEIEMYLQYIRSYYPQNIKTVEKDYLWLISNSLFQMEKSPQEALKWAQKAVSLEPNFIKGRYLLGSLYISLEKYDEAVTMLEPVFESVMQSEEFDEPGSSLENHTTKSECYLSTGTKLAQCYMLLGKYDKVKQVYSNLLNEPLLEIPEQQRANIRAILAKLEKAPPAPVTAAKQNHIPAPVKSEGRYLVSAIISTYNSEKFLRGCLDDLEKQTIADKLEIIIVNSGSQENEEEIVHEYRQKYNNIVYIKTEQREGIYAAWNRAVRVAQGTFITNANTDDRHRNDALGIMAKTLQENPDTALVYGDQICTDTPNGTFDSHHATEMAKRPEYSQGRLLFGCCVGSQPMWRKSLHNELGYFDETLTCAGDWDFWLRISSKYKFRRIPDFLGLYYYNKNGIEHGSKIHSLYERYLVGRRYGNPYISVIPVYKNQDNPLVSVIMPAYNAAEHIAEAIESVLIQNYRNFELIIIDDGSTDNTKDIIAGFKDDKIKYFYKDNGGPSSARNFAINKAGGLYIMPLDADDMMTPDFIAKHLMEFEKHPHADLVYCNVLLIDDNSNPLRIMEKPEYPDHRHLVRDMFRMGHPVLPFRLGIRRSVFDKIGLYDEDLQVSEDYDMMRRFVKADLKAHHLSDPLHLRRMHPDSLSKNNLSQKAKCHFEVVRRFTETFTCDELFPDVAWNEIAPERKPLHVKCLVASTYLAVGQAHVAANSPPVYTKTAFEMAWSQLNECLEMDPNNRQIRDLMQKCELGRQKYEQQTQSVVC